MDIYLKTCEIIKTVKENGKIIRDDRLYKAWKLNDLQIIESKRLKRYLLIDSDNLNISIPYKLFEFHAGRKEDLNKVYQDVFRTKICPEP